MPLGKYRQYKVADSSLIYKKDENNNCMVINMV